MNGLLHIYQFPFKANYHTRNTHIKEHGLENIISNFTRPGQGHRIVFKSIYKISTGEEIKLNLKWEREYRLKERHAKMLLSLRLQSKNSNSDVQLKLVISQSIQDGNSTSIPKPE